MEDLPDGQSQGRSKSSKAASSSAQSSQQHPELPLTCQEGRALPLPALPPVLSLNPMNRAGVSTGCSSPQQLPPPSLRASALCPVMLGCLSCWVLWFDTYGDKGEHVCPMTWVPQPQREDKPCMPHRAAKLSVISNTNHRKSCQIRGACPDKESRVFLPWILAPVCALLPHILFFSHGCNMESLSYVPQTNHGLSTGHMTRSCQRTITSCQGTLRTAQLCLCLTEG